MEGRQPGERADPQARSKGGLDRPPSERYAVPAQPGAATGVASPIGPLARAAIAAAIGAALLTVVGAILASTAGLLAVSGITGAAVGLLLARARVPREGLAAPFTPRTVTVLAIGLTVGAVLVAAAGTWLIARGEGGTLGPIDYLLETFGPFVPGEALVGAVAAAWGAAAGPVQG